MIPIARFVDCIEHPGKVIDFNGEKITYPTIRLLVWGGGNPFTHQPDTMRLERAWRSEQLEATIVIETHWTATAKHADIVLPATTVYERNDISGAGEQARNMIVAMHQLVPPQGECRDDYWITSELAAGSAFLTPLRRGKRSKTGSARRMKKPRKRLSCHSTPCRPLRNSGDPGS